MSGNLTKEGWNRIIKGQFPDGIVTGRIAIRLEGQNAKTGAAVFTFMLVAQEDNAVLFEYEKTNIQVGQEIVLTGATVSSPIQVVEEE